MEAEDVVLLVGTGAALGAVAYYLYKSGYLPIPPTTPSQPSQPHPDYKVSLFVVKPHSGEVVNLFWGQPKVEFKVYNYSRFNYDNVVIKCYGYQMNGSWNKVYENYMSISLPPNTYYKGSFQTSGFSCPFNWWTTKDAKVRVEVWIGDDLVKSQEIPFKVKNWII